MKLLSTWQDFVTNGRIRIDLGFGIVLDTWDIRPPDTGWRKLSNPSGIGGNVFMRRRGNDVHMMFQAVTVTTAGHQNVAAIPVGFQPQAFTGANWRNGPAMDDAGTSIRTFSYYVGNMRILNAETGKGYGGYINFISSDAFPAANNYPGTAA